MLISHNYSKKKIKNVIIIHRDLKFLNWGEICFNSPMNPSLDATKTICTHFIIHFSASGGASVLCTLAVQGVRGQLLPLWQGAAHGWPQAERGSAHGCWQLPPAKHSPRWQIRLQRWFSQGSVLLHVRPQEMSCRWHGMLLRCCEAEEETVTLIAETNTKVNQTVGPGGKVTSCFPMHHFWVRYVQGGHFSSLWQLWNTKWERSMLGECYWWLCSNAACICTVLSHLGGRTRASLCTCFCTLEALCHMRWAGTRQWAHSDMSAHQNLQGRIRKSRGIWAVWQHHVTLLPNKPEKHPKMMLKVNQVFDFQQGTSETWPIKGRWDYSTHWTASRAHSFHGGRAPGSGGGHSWACSRRPGGTCAPHSGQTREKPMTRLLMDSRAFIRCVLQAEAKSASPQFETSIRLKLWSIYTTKCKHDGFQLQVFDQKCGKQKLNLLQLVSAFLPVLYLAVGHC